MRLVEDFQFLIRQRDFRHDASIRRWETAGVSSIASCLMSQKRLQRSSVSAPFRNWRGRLRRPAPLEHGYSDVRKSQHLRTQLHNHKCLCARVSTDGQSLVAQLEDLKGAGCRKIFREKASGARSDRPGLAKLLLRSITATAWWYLAWIGWHDPPVICGGSPYRLV
jgi:hypothetical protein